MDNKKYNYIENNDGTFTLEFCEGVKELNDPVFWSMERIEERTTQVNIPSTVESVSCCFVDTMMYVKRFQVDPANEHFIEVDGCVYSVDMRELIAYPPGKLDYFFEIPSSVEIIAPWAFCCNNNLRCINIGSNVKAIGLGAFAGAFSLQHIYIDKSVDVIEDFFGHSGDLDCYISDRIGRVVAGVADSAIERWCSENATYFFALKDDQVDDFITSPVWTRDIPELSDKEYLACWNKTGEEYGLLIREKIESERYEKQIG